MRIYLGGHLNFYHPQRGYWLDVDLEQPRPLRDVLEDSGIALGEVYLVVINGKIIDLQEAVISEQDNVKLFSAVGGG